MAEALRDTCSCDQTDLVQGLIPVNQAIRLTRALAEPIRECTTVELRVAVGRVAAADILAPRPMPFFDNAAMDGFAVRCADLEDVAPWRLPVFGAVAAGAVLNGVEERAGAYRIFTGAPIPHGFDAVIMQENCGFDGQVVTIDAVPHKGGNIRYRGEDIAQGEKLVAAGTVLEARHIGLLAANGIANVSVLRKIRIAILSSGDEVRRGGSLNNPAAIYDANGPMLEALCSGAMFETTDVGVLPDELGTMIDALAALSGQHDIIISTGAASNGARDLLRGALGAAGGRVDAYRVGIKPGKPVFFGRLGNALYTGLPGNSLAAFVGFELFVKAQIAALAGLPHRSRNQARVILRDTIRRKPGREEYLPVRIAGGSPDRPVVEMLGSGSSATLFPLAKADGMAVVPAQCKTLESGDVVTWFPFPRLSDAFGA